MKKQTLDSNQTFLGVLFSPHGTAWCSFQAELLAGPSPGKGLEYLDAFPRFNSTPLAWVLSHVTFIFSRNFFHLKLSAVKHLCCP